MYFERVCMTTSSGSSGPGAVLSQPVCSQKSRTNCLSKLSCARPGSYASAGQKREESGVSASSPSTRSPLGVEPELELRVGDDDPARQRVVGRRRVERDRDPLDLGEPLRADELGRLRRG